MSDMINYDVPSIENAMRCLKSMRELENKKNFGKISYSTSSDFSNKRYSIREYKDRIDSTFYIDIATSTLASTIEYLQHNFNEKFQEDIISYAHNINEIAKNNGLDLINNSDEEFANFQLEESTLKLEGLDDLNNLNLYYSGIELVDNKDYIANKQFLKGTLANGDEYYIYIPKNASSNTPVIYYTYGSGGADPNWKKVAESAVNADAISIFPVAKGVTRSKGYEGGKGATWGNLMIQVLDHTIENFNIPIDNVIPVSHSLGAAYSLNAYAEYIRHYSIDKPQPVVLLEGYKTTSGIEDETIKTLKETETVVLAFSRKDYDKNKDGRYTKLGELGINTVIIEDLSIKTHQQVQESFFTNEKRLDYVCGKAPLINHKEGYNIIMIKDGKSIPEQYDNINTIEKNYKFYGIDLTKNDAVKLSNEINRPTDPIATLKSEEPKYKTTEANLESNLTTTQKPVQNETTKFMVTEETTSTTNNLSKENVDKTANVDKPKTESPKEPEQNNQTKKPVSSNSHKSNSNNNNHYQKQTSKINLIEEISKYQEIYSDESKTVYNIDDKYTITVYKDGNKIIGIEQYYNFETKEQADKILANLNKEYVDNIKQEGQYIKIVLKKEIYKNLTVNDIKQANI